MLIILKSWMRRYRGTAALLELYFLRKFYLKQSGWLESRYLSQPVDQDKNPIPWLTYSSIHFLNQALSPKMSLFEYGSGNSTLWYSQRVRHIVSVEHDKSFFDLIESKIGLLPNVDLSYAELPTEYIESIKSTGQKFDVVVIDGRERVSCSRMAVDYLTDSGVIIWDNSERQRYQEGIEFLQKKGFRKIDFMGHGPIGHHQSCTSIFYRKDNCLEI